MQARRYFECEDTGTQDIANMEVLYSRPRGKGGRSQMADFILDRKPPHSALSSRPAFHHRGLIQFNLCRFRVVFVFARMDLSVGIQDSGLEFKAPRTLSVD